MQTPYRKPGKYAAGNTDPMMTQEKFDELKKKLERLQKSQPEAAKEVSRLAEFGDFSENVEYQLAKGKLRSINSNILKLQKQLDHAVLITPLKQNNRIEIGHTVSLDTGTTIKTYQILGSSETNPHKGIISHTSPLGIALLGKKVGDVVHLPLANKEVEYTIVAIN